MIEAPGPGRWTVTVPPDTSVDLLYRAADILPTLQPGWNETECPPPAVDSIDLQCFPVLRTEDGGRLVDQHIGSWPRTIFGSA
jgi:hypothetical protein